MSMVLGRPNLLGGRPWAPYLGQTAPATATFPAQAQPAVVSKPSVKESLLASAELAGTSAAAGAVIGMIVNVIAPTVRIPRKEAWKIAGASAGVSALGMALSAMFGPSRFYSMLTGVGGVLAGNAAADVIIPAPKSLISALPSVG